MVPWMLLVKTINPACWPRARAHASTVMPVPRATLACEGMMAAIQRQSEPFCRAIPPAGAGRYSRSVSSGALTVTAPDQPTIVKLPQVIENGLDTHVQSFGQHAG